MMGLAQIKTQWVQPKPPRNRPTSIGKVDLESLQITNDKPVQTRVRVGNKYAELFQQLQVGQCIKCRPEDTGRVSAALRHWIMDNLDVTKFGIKAISKYPEDGMGRVWLVAKEGKR